MGPVLGIRGSLYRGFEGVEGAVVGLLPDCDVLGAIWLNQYKSSCSSLYTVGYSLTIVEDIPFRVKKANCRCQRGGKVGGEAVDVGAELMVLSNNIISRMTLSRTSSQNEGEADVVRKVVIDAAELSGKFNISDFISFCKIFDLQGFNKRLKEVRERFDTLLERVIEEHQEGRRKSKEMGARGDKVRNILDVLLDIYEDEKSEMKLTKENIKAFIFVSSVFLF